MKIIAFLINAIFWLQLFIVPAGILSFAGLWIYYKYNSGLFFPLFFGIAGAISGIALAEYVRRHYGLDNFWGGLYHNPDFDKDKDGNSD